MKSIKEIKKELVEQLDLTSVISSYENDITDAVTKGKSWVSVWAPTIALNVLISECKNAGYKVYDCNALFEGKTLIALTWGEFVPPGIEL